MTQVLQEHAYQKVNSTFFSRDYFPVGLFLSNIPSSM